MKITRMVSINGWELQADSDQDEQPTIGDLEPGAKLGFERPNKVRELIVRLRTQGFLNDIDCRPAAGQTTVSPFEQPRIPKIACRLTERGALKVIAKSETKLANQILEQVIDVYIAYRRGVLPTSMATPSTTARIGDNDLARHDVASRCRLAASATGLSLRRIHGAVRKQFVAAGLYQIPLAMLPIVREYLEALSLGRLILVTTRRRLKPADERQLKLKLNVN